MPGGVGRTEAGRARENLTRCNEPAGKGISQTGIEEPIRPRTPTAIREGTVADTDRMARVRSSESVHQVRKYRWTTRHHPIHFSPVQPDALSFAPITGEPTADGLPAERRDASD